MLAFKRGQHNRLRKATPIGDAALATGAECL
jgi:hypothetical protein